MRYETGERRLPRSAAAFYGAGGSLLLATVALPGDHSENVPIAVIAATAIAAGVGLAVGGHRLPFGAFHLVVACGTALIGIIVGIGGDQAVTSYAALYTFVALFAFYWFAPRPAFAHLGLIGLSCGAGLAAHDGGPGDGGDFVMYFGTAAVAGLVVRWLVRQVRAAARTDSLTGLANRRAWEATLVREMARSHRDGNPLCVVIADLDDFKHINDSAGHSGGDLRLKAVATAWAHTIRAVDELGRWGGDEFAIVLPHCDAIEATAIVERLRAAIPDGQKFSAGIATWSAPESVDDVVQRADTALYSAKAAGGDRAVVAASD